MPYFRKGWLLLEVIEGWKNGSFVLRAAGICEQLAVFSYVIIIGARLRCEACEVLSCREACEVLLSPRYSADRTISSPALKSCH